MNQLASFARPAPFTPFSSSDRFVSIVRLARRARAYGRLLRVHAVAMLLLLPFLAASVAAADQEMARIQTRIGADRVWATLTDFSRWPNIFPDLVSLCEEVSDDDKLLLRQAMRSFGLQLVHTSRVDLDPASRRLDLELAPSYPHGLEEFTSTWIVTSLDDESSVIELRVRADLALPIPGFVKRSLLRDSVQESAQALIDAAEDSAPGDAEPLGSC